MFFGPATPSQFESLLIWRKKSRARVTAATAVPEVPEPRRDSDEVQADSLDIYALSVGRTSGR